MSLKNFMDISNMDATLSFVLFIFIALLTLIQIAPIRINPWDAVLRWVGERVNGNLQKEFRAFWVDFHRQAILQFCRECRKETEHTREEWHYILDAIAKYEKYCHQYGIINGVIEEDSRFIRELYQELCKQNKI